MHSVDGRWYVSAGWVLKTRAHQGGCGGNKNKKEHGIIWEGEGLKEVGKRADTGDIVVKIDPNYFRPCEVDTLLGDPTKASRELGWEATATLEDLVNEMIKFDKEEALKEALLRNKGFKINSSFESPPSTNK